MANNLLINAKDIELWAARLDARSQLPRLVRRLVQATTPQLERLHFAADEGVQMDGWDGIVTAGVGNAFVPTGVSVWEMGVDKNPKGKADDDYEKRSQNPLGLDPKATTFVFVTPRRWKNKEIWAKSRREEGKWADVRAYDADDIETWLDQAPAVYFWLSMLLGKYPQGAWALEDYWTDWRAKTEPTFSPALVLGGRPAARERIEKWLHGDALPLALGGESVEESLSFLAAVIADQEQPEREAWFSRAIVVEDAAAWRELALSRSRSILVPRFRGEVEGISRAIQNGNHVFLPKEHGGERGSEALPRLVRAAAEEALKEMGLPHDRARDLATLARRSFPALRRKLASEPMRQKSQWAQPHVARELLAPLLASTWQAENRADREILARLAGTSYEQLQEILVRWSKAEEPPVRLVGGIWMMAAPDDAWLQLAPFLTNDDIGCFKAAALEVLSAPAKPESAIVELFTRNGEGPRISGHLREGIASTLALMAALSSEVTFVSGVSGEEVARIVVWTVFEKAKGNADFWIALAPVLPLLAEAAPTPFLDTVDAGLGGETPFLSQMFYDQDRSHGMGPTSPHTYLLWALETLVWNPDFFGRAVLALARLARIQPHYRNGNKASGSLREIFVVWYPNTTVSVARRLNVLDAVRKREPEVAWRLMLGVLPTIHGSTCFPVHGPKWHDWKPDKEAPVFNNEVAQMVEGLVERLLSDVKAGVARWSELLARAGDLWPHLREKLLETLESLDPTLFASEERVALSARIRSQVLRHREFPDADWTMPEEHLVRLEAVVLKMEPNDPVFRYRWRFERFVPIPERREMSWQERDEVVTQLRNEALQDILAMQGWEGVLRLASEVEDPESVGLALNSMPVAPIDVDAFLAENLASPESWRAATAMGWLRPNAWRDNQPWLQARLQAAQNVWRPEQWGEFYLPFPITSTVLSQVGGLDEEAQRYFWSRTPNAMLENAPQDAEKIIERLLWVGRSGVAIRAIHWSLHKSPDLVAPECILDVLDAAISGASGEELNATHYDSAELFEHLAKTDAPRERLVPLEWAYFAIHEHTRSPKILYAELARDPELFVELLSFVYCAHPGETETDDRNDDATAPQPEPEPINEEEALNKKFMAERAWSLLWHWHQIPGLREDGTLDEDHLKNWVTKARELGQRNERSVITLIQIGQTLAYSPRDEDGAWPHRAVRDIIEDIGNPRLESGFNCQVFNNRGVTTRGLTDGGSQERFLAEGYEKDAAQIADIWPRTASVLRDIARGYRGQAEHEDRSADLTQDRWK
ncbi:MAG TPA: hypothetical protein VF627_11110 [Abditibacterium sp.]|jgi:hypothetical protein